MTVDEELRSGVALIFRRKAKDYLTEREFVFSASMDLRWFNYTDAMKFLDLAVSRGHVRREGKAVTPNFDHRALDLPAAFRPSPDILLERAGPAPATSETVFIRLVDEAARKGGQDRAVVISRINRKREELKLEAEVLALLVAKEMGADIFPFLEEAERVVRERIARRVEEGTEAAGKLGEEE